MQLLSWIVQKYLILFLKQSNLVMSISSISPCGCNILYRPDDMTHRRIGHTVRWRLISLLIRIRVRYDG